MYYYKKIGVYLMNLKKVFFVVLGCLSLGLGALGAVLPLLPAFPFLMSIGFIMMHAVPVGRIVLGIVWLFHILYFIFGIKTLKIEDI